MFCSSSREEAPQRPRLRPRRPEAGEPAVVAGLAFPEEQERQVLQPGLEQEFRQQEEDLSSQEEPLQQLDWVACANAAVAPASGLGSAAATRAR